MARRRSPRPSAEIVSAVVEVKNRAEEEKARREGKMTGKKESIEEDDLRANSTMDEHQISFEELYGAMALILPRASPRHKSPRSRISRFLTSSRHPREKSEILKLLETQTGFFNLLLWAGAPFASLATSE